MADESFSDNIPGSHPLAKVSAPGPVAANEVPDALQFNMQTVYLGGLFILALLAACYAAAGIVLPIVLAFVMKLVLAPVMRLMHKLNVPRTLSAFLMIVILLGTFVGLGAALSLPASNWAHELPNDMPKLKERLDFLRAPMRPLEKALHNADSLAGPHDAKMMTVAVAGSGFSDKIIASTKSFASSLFEMLIVLFFMLMSGDTFLRRLVEVLPRFQEKKQAISISNQIESDISAYLTTITMMNAIVGVATAIIMFACGMSDALLWGTIAFLVNYIPIVGPLIGFVLFAAVGLMTQTSTFAALLPAGLYLIVHLIEGEAVTPMLLAKRFTLNPVLVILSLIFWYWMWGVAGAVLSTPMLAITKIICDRIERLKAFGHFMEG